MHTAKITAARGTKLDVKTLHAQYKELWASIVDKTDFYAELEFDLTLASVAG